MKEQIDYFRLSTVRSACTQPFMSVILNGETRRWSHRHVRSMRMAGSFESTPSNRLYISCPHCGKCNLTRMGISSVRGSRKRDVPGTRPSRRIREWRKNEVMSICMKDVSGLLRRVITIQITIFPGGNSSMILQVATRTDRERVDLHLKVDFS